MATIVFVSTLASTAHTDCAEAEQQFKKEKTTYVLYFDIATVGTWCEKKHQGRRSLLHQPCTLKLHF